MHQADFRVDAQSLRPGSGIGNEESADDARQGDDEHRHARVQRTCRVEDRQPREHRRVGNAVERRVVERAEDTALSRSARHRAIDDIKKGRQAEKPTAGPDVAGAVNDAAATEQNVPSVVMTFGMHAVPDKKGGNGLDEAYVPVFDPLPQTYHV